LGEVHQREAGVELRAAERVHVHAVGIALRDERTDALSQLLLGHGDLPPSRRRSLKLRWEEIRYRSDLAAASHDPSARHRYRDAVDALVTAAAHAVAASDVLSEPVH